MQHSELPGPLQEAQAGKSQQEPGLPRNLALATIHLDHLGFMREDLLDLSLLFGQTFQEISGKRMSLKLYYPHTTVEIIRPINDAFIRNVNDFTRQVLTDKLVIHEIRDTQPSHVYFASRQTERSEAFRELEERNR